MRKLTADWIFPISGPPVRDGVLILDAQGRVEAVGTREGHDPLTLERHAGAIVPGFVNAHCHLELSHLKGLVQTGTTLIPFIQSVVQNRGFPQEAIQESLRAAEQEMLDNGIVAVGDISNAPDTFAQKSLGRLDYYTFVEFFDLFQDGQARATFERTKAVYDALLPAAGSDKSCVPHAPYSVSDTLWSLLRTTHPSDRTLTISIHNQETPPENELLRDGTGAFVDFYRSIGLSTDHLRGTGQTAIHAAIRRLDPGHRTLFVHNTLTERADIEAAHAWSPHVFWATCPNANLYIENRLPYYRHFLETGARVCLGTDSLTSNWHLSILEEMKTIAKYQSYVPLETLLRWATLHGAQALGFDERLGSFEPGKKPGANLLSLGPELRLDASTTLKRLA